MRSIVWFLFALLSAYIFAKKPVPPASTSSKTTTLTGPNFSLDPIVNDNFGPTEPQQVHTTYFDFPYPHFGITFSTWEPCKCRVLSHDLQATFYNITTFIDNGTLHHTQYVHFVEMSRIQSGVVYPYTISCPDSRRDFAFQAPDLEGPTKVIVLGDCGLQNFFSFERILQEAVDGLWDVILHNGDFAYDMYNNNGSRGDMFMNLMEPVVSKFPYMVSPGNHEAEYSFLHYRMRFNMPKPYGFSECCPNGENAFFSWNLGQVHFVTYSTEVYFWPDQTQNIAPQLAWLEADLARANKNRDLRPWIVVMGHRPMYSSSIPMQGNIIRDQFELLFCQMGVDVILEAHEHNYERTFPLFNGTVFNGSYAEPYVNYQAPVHFINGAAGNSEKHEAFHYNNSFTAFRASSKYGYGHLTVFNSSHLLWEQIFDLDLEEPIDSVWLVKESHGPFSCPTTPSSSTH